MGGSCRRAALTDSGRERWRASARFWLANRSSATATRSRISTCIIGPRGSAAETAFCNALTNNKDGFTTLLAVIAPNLPCKPNTVLFNKVTIKDAKQAVQMFGPAQYAVAKAVQRLRRRGHDPGSRGRRPLHLRRRLHPLGRRRRRQDPATTTTTRRSSRLQRAVRGEPSCGRHRRAAQPPRIIPSLRTLAVEGNHPRAGGASATMKEACFRGWVLLSGRRTDSSHDDASPRLSASAATS